MNNIKIVTIELTIKPDMQENLIELKMNAAYNIEEFKHCKTLEEMKNHFLEKSGGDEEEIEQMSIKTYRNMEDITTNNYINILIETGKIQHTIKEDE